MAEIERRRDRSLLLTIGSLVGIFTLLGGSLWAVASFLHSTRIMCQETQKTCEEIHKEMHVMNSIKGGQRNGSVSDH